MTIVMTISFHQKKTSMKIKRWWKYAVLRGPGIPARLDGMWYDLDQIPEYVGQLMTDSGINMEATNQWEQRDDGEVAVVYRMFNYEG